MSGGGGGGDGHEQRASGTRKRQTKRTKGSERSEGCL